MTHPAELSACQTLAEAFSRSVQIFPDRIAVQCAAASLSYQQLDQRADALARRLRAMGVNAETLVGLSVRRSSNLIVAMLAILKAGGAYLPLDPEYPAERLDYLIDDARPKLIVVDAESRERLAAAASAKGIPQLDLDAFPSRDDHAEMPAGGAPNRDGLAYVIYTSGSTGGPKGSLITHRNVLRLFTESQPYYDFGPEDVWPLLHSYAFDFSVWEIFGALLHGGTLLVPDLAIIRDPSALLAYLRRHGVTVLNQTPSFFYQLALYLSEHPEQREALESLAFVVFGGERLDLTQLKPWFKTMGDDGPVLVNMYGITETTVHVTLHVVDADETKHRKSAGIGSALPDLSLFLLDEDLKPVAVGDVGELYVAGPGLARGYHGRPGLTAETFIPCPFPGHEGQRMYKTQDLAKIDPHGELVYESRKGGYLKIRGFRVSLAEIESALCELDGVANAVVQASAEDGRDLVSAYLRFAAAPMSLRELRHALAEKLPGFMMPHHFHCIDSLPLTAHGKIDRSRLPHMARALSDERPPDAPASADEADMMAIWSQVLGVERLGPHDDFFALGGDSIRAVELIMALNRAGWNATVEDVFHSPNVRDLNDRSLRGETGLPPPPAKLANAVSDMQRLMLEQYQAAPAGLGVYHVQQWFDCEDAALDIERLTQAFRLEFSRHPVFRTLFVRDGDAILRVDAGTERARLDAVDLRRDAPSRQQTRIAEYARADLHAPFKPFEAASEMARLRFFQTTDSRCVVFLSIHHAIDDGWGQQRFFDAVFQRYRRHAAAASAARADVFSEYVALQQQMARDPAAIEYWRQTPFAEKQTVERWRAPPTRMIEHKKRIAPRLVAHAGPCARARRIQTRSLYLAAAGQAIARATRDPRVLIGMVVNGRVPELSDPLEAVGLFWNLQPLSFQALECPLETADAIHQRLLLQEKYALYPLSAIFEARSPGREFLYTFNFTNFRALDSKTADLRDWDGVDRFHYPINIAVHLDEGSDIAEFRLSGDPAYCGEAAAEALFQAFEETLGIAVGALADIGA
ncbi:amino acid adenylation domain-containing protein [Chromobacterium haemolyticum]|uniref:Amino acid adenylation domain-containing protein n=1 Tax=Chromobacterium haemolyticum TaxID=394935 RepID=A0ABS3GVU5_9NEIS|nr:amino acid adenylation domain-containing protein [Chromobacterium haemolyticum]MBK0417321.1 amino acid adenylation domain-containing protein [Chromobacterium haemolyticum]MBO0418388.1 amino acid adenylation domain-containing protein [Chromobacterium haemolyticum]MBO0501748.1 amino acid adenylation domain-containing protein [Chromobacterium haemolyticum]